MYKPGFFNPDPKPPKRKRLSPYKYRKLKEAVHRRDGWTCINPECQCKVFFHMPPINYVLTIHHDTKRSQSGNDDLVNCATVCMHCHDAIEKHRIDDGFVGEYLEGLYPERRGIE